MRQRLSFRVALCGVLAALMAAILLLGTMIPGTTYLCPALAGAFLIPVLWELGIKAGLLVYGVVSLLSLLLTPDKEAALFFVLLFGWYPLLRPRLQHLKKKPLRGVVKFLLFNLSLLVIALLTVFVLGLPLVEEGGPVGPAILMAGFLILGNVSFLLYDILLGRLSNLYVLRLRPKLFPRHLS